jgi:RNase P subunit RPR2
MAIIKARIRTDQPEKSLIVIKCDECWRRIRANLGSIEKAEVDAGRGGWLITQHGEHFCPKHY